VDGRVGSGLLQCDSLNDRSWHFGDIAQLSNEVCLPPASGRSRDSVFLLKRPGLPDIKGSGFPTMRFPKAACGRGLSVIAHGREERLKVRDYFQAVKSPPDLGEI
jgi:hypothetical protein